MLSDSTTGRQEIIKARMQEQDGGHLRQLVTFRRKNNGPT